MEIYQFIQDSPGCSDISLPGNLLVNLLVKPAKERLDFWRDFFEA